ncbi:LAFA_0F21836g1_1 [Lachancea sp. 'fantastica']|nr:LAFA_0F21836g1_1 [Lachancea sp. 'fantastica']
MKVAIVGANGRVGRHICKILKASDDFSPLAIVRSEEQRDYFKKDLSIEASLTSIEDSSVDQIGKAFEGCGAVVWTAGAGGKGVDRILTVDLDGSLKVMEACKKYNIPRLIMVSAINAENREFWWNTALKLYYIAKRTADIVLRSSDLEYTILQPGSLGDGPAKGKLTAPDQIQTKKKDFYAIEREDVAQFVLVVLQNPEKTSRKTIELANGDISFEEFLNKI